MIRDEAVCIRHWDWSETSQTVSLFAREHGVLRGLAKGSRRERSPFSGGIELLTRGELGAITRATGALATITSWDLLDTFPAARQSLRAFYVGTYLVDLIHHMVTDEDPHPGLYDAIVAALAALGDATEQALLRGQWAVLVETGYRPELHADVARGDALGTGEPLRFSPRLGGLQRQAASGEVAWGVRPETVALLRGISEGRSAAGEDAVVAGRAARLLGSYLRHILGRSLPTMEPVFGQGGLQA